MTNVLFQTWRKCAGKVANPVIVEMEQAVYLTTICSWLVGSNVLFYIVNHFAMKVASDVTISCNISTC